VGRGDIHYGRAAGLVLDAIDDRGLVFGGQVGAAALRTEGLLDAFYKRAKIGILGVDFVYDDQPWLMGLGSELEESSGVGFDTGCGADDYTGGFSGGYCGDCGSNEVWRARCIDDIDGFAGMLGVDHCGLYGMLMVLFFLVVVADGGLLIDAAQPVCGAGFVQYCLSERGFAASGVSEEYYITNIADIGHF
jgi:hypothetical protein